jgi:hypothetical protein
VPKEHKHLVIAIDGPAASGKSSVARALARKLRFVYVNTGDYSMMFTKSYGLYGPNGSQAYEWAWSPQSATESQISWGPAWTTVPPTNREVFVRSGDWVTLTGWYDNGTFYRLTVTTEWQAAADCRTGRTALPVGGPQHYVRWTLPATAYCLFAAGTITEVSSGKVRHFEHQQLWSPPATNQISQWESWSDDASGAMTLTLERTQWLTHGKGPAQRIVQTTPSAWTATANSTGRWGA